MYQFNNLWLMFAQAVQNYKLFVIISFAAPNIEYAT